MLLLFAIQTTQAQAHNMGSNYNCKLQKKGYFFNSEKHPCPACAAKDKKEKDAKIAEDKRRFAAAQAEAEAKKAASEKVRLEKLRIEAAEAKRIKDKEIADKIANDAMMKKYKEIAEKGKVKSNTKGTTTTTNFSLNKIEPFTDKTRKIYGFKIDGVEVLTFPFEYENVSFTRLANGANYFRVSNYSGVNKYGSPIFLHYFLVNHLGLKLEIDGTKEFDDIDFWENTIYLIKKTSQPEIVTSRKCYNPQSGGIVIYDSRESALAQIETLLIRHGGYAMCYDYKICNVEQYKVDLKGKLIEKNVGIQLLPYRQ